MPKMHNDVWSMACRLSPAGTIPCIAFTCIFGRLSMAEDDIDGWPDMGGGQEKRAGGGEPEEEEESVCARRQRLEKEEDDK